jgi:hypothetical protein
MSIQGEAKKKKKIGSVECVIERLWIQISSISRKKWANSKWGKKK